MEQLFMHGEIEPIPGHHPLHLTDFFQSPPPIGHPDFALTLVSTMVGAYSFTDRNKADAFALGIPGSSVVPRMGGLPAKWCIRVGEWLYVHGVVPITSAGEKLLASGDPAQVPAPGAG